MQPLQHTNVKTANLDIKAANMEFFSEHELEKNPGGFGRIRTYLIYLFLLGSCLFAAYAYLTRPNEAPAIDTVLELQNITSNITQDDDWNLNRINLIFYHWGNLSKNQQQKIKQTKWFAQFAAALSENLKRNQYLDSLERTADNNVHDLLNTLAVVIDAPNISYKYSTSEPITKVMRDKLVKIQDQAGTDKRPASSAANSVKNSALIESDKNSEVDKPVPRKQSQTVAQAKPVIREDSSIQVATQSSEVSRPTQGKANSSNTSSTSTPVASKDTALQASMSQSNDTINKKQQVEVSESTAGKIPVKNPTNLLAKANNPMIAAKPELHINKSRNVAHPTPAELDYVINQYIDGYEKGNVNKILELLSLNAKTSAQSNAKEIGAYLTDLFSSTKDRQLFIRNVKWKYEGNIAKGVGDIHTMLLPGKTTGEIVSTKGKIQIIAKKVNNTVLITHLYSTQNPR